jgi:hypothetical protein
MVPGYSERSMSFCVDVKLRPFENTFLAFHRPITKEWPACKILGMLGLRAETGAGKAPHIVKEY